MDTPTPTQPLSLKVFLTRLYLKHVVVALLISTLVLSLAEISLWQSKRNNQERASVATQNFARLFEQQIRDTLEKIQLLLQASSHFYQYKRGSGEIDINEMNLYVAQQLRLIPEINGLRLADAEGNVLFGTDVSPQEPVKVNDRQYFQQASKQTGQALILDGPIVSRFSHQWVMILAQRLNNPDGSFAGVMYASLPCKHFETILSLASLGPQGAATIRTGNFALVHRFPDTKNAIGKTEVSPQLHKALAQHPDGGEYIAVTTLDKVERYNAYRKINPYPLYVIVGLSTHDSLQGWQSSRWLTIALTGLTLLLTWIAVTRIYLSQYRLNENIANYIRISDELAASMTEREQLYTELAMRKNALQEANATLEEQVAQRTAELSRANQQLDRLAHRDPLTRLGNRLSADEHLHDEFVRMKRTRIAYSLLLVDVDHFKNVNDTYGHEQGDKVLQHIAGILNHCCRASDFIARFGGEEFLVILPNTSLKNAAVVAQKMCHAVETNSIPPLQTLTVSIGIAEANPSDLEEHDALRRVDVQLYRAKSAGRNRVSYALDAAMSA